MRDLIAGVHGLGERLDGREIHRIDSRQMRDVVLHPRDGRPERDVQDERNRQHECEHAEIAVPRGDEEERQAGGRGAAYVPGPQAT